MLQRSKQQGYYKVFTHGEGEPFAIPLKMRAPGLAGQLRDGLLQSINLKEFGRAENGNAIECVVPRIVVAAQFLKRLQQRMNFVLPDIFSERLLQLFDEVPKAERVLLIAGS